MPESVVYSLFTENRVAVIIDISGVPDGSLTFDLLFKETEAGAGELIVAAFKQGDAGEF